MGDERKAMLWHFVRPTEPCKAFGCSADVSHSSPQFAASQRLVWPLLRPPRQECWLLVFLRSPR